VPRPTAPRPSRTLALLALALAGLLLGLIAAPARAMELVRLEAQRQEAGVALGFETRFDLPPSVEDALQRGVALHFSAEAVLMRARWYWRDKEVARTSRTWRIAYQPLTFSYKVSQGGLSQTYRTLGEAMRAVQRIHQWRIADPVPEPDESGKRRWPLPRNLDFLAPRTPLNVAITNQRRFAARTVPLAD